MRCPSCTHPMKIAAHANVVSHTILPQAMQQWDRMGAGYVGCLKHGAVWTEPGGWMGSASPGRFGITSEYASPICQRVGLGLCGLRMGWAGRVHTPDMAFSVATVLPNDVIAQQRAHACPARRVWKRDHQCTTALPGVSMHVFTLVINTPHVWAGHHGGPVDAGARRAAL